MLNRTLQEYVIEGHNIIAGKISKRCRGRYESSPFATLHRLKGGEIDKAVCDTLESIGSSKLVMVVWGWPTEFQAIASTIPPVTSCTCTEEAILVARHDVIDWL
ncbi:hypothetical protein NPX13_g4925 [Xylaria arbuscula]|uniref:Uncharacterized protein n=1 Tax=Xylaria arbuscula TaxID=114810 RepID=A0A9W8NFG0_9PEZI|nr:hypothetical protein NPX13_g4925 [Xylaria arbuscula]